MGLSILTEELSDPICDASGSVAFFDSCFSFLDKSVDDLHQIVSFGGHLFPELDHLTFGLVKLFHDCIKIEKEGLIFQKKYQPTDDFVKIRELVRIEKTYILPEEYTAFRDFCLEVDNKEHEDVTISPKIGANN